MFTSTAAHYLLFSEARIDSTGRGAWRFVLQPVGAGEAFSASDLEEAECGERLELLAVVRGLESLDQSAKVTLVTKSRYVHRGLKRGLCDWRASGWQWERFGRIVPVRDHDLWRRVDRALHFHQVDCRLWQFDGDAELGPAAPAPAEPSAATAGRFVTAARERLRRASRAAASLGDAFLPAGLAAG